MRTHPRCWLALAAMLIVPAGRAAPHAQGSPPSVSVSASAPAARPLDRSGKTRHGKASYYRRAGKKMANGEKMDPAGNAAASKTLPLGTTAKVTNLDNDKSAVVVVKDRGPYVDGRIIDVTPATAGKLDMKEDGVAPVKVEPLHVPRQEPSAAPGK